MSDDGTYSSFPSSVRDSMSSFIPVASAKRSSQESSAPSRLIAPISETGTDDGLPIDTGLQEAEAHQDLKSATDAGLEPADDDYIVTDTRSMPAPREFDQKSKSTTTKAGASLQV